MDKTKALQNLLKGKATKKEIELLKQALASGEISIGRDVQNSIVITGSGNTISLTPEALNLLNPDLAKQTKTEAPVAGKPPYMGLRYFDASDADLFFGRDALTRELLARAQKESFLAIVGASGSGKSSVARAGLIPAWTKENVKGIVHVITPTAHPLESLAASLTHDSESVTATATLMDDLAKDVRSLRLFVKKAFGETKVLLLVDQFEETFTLCKNQEERKAFIENLLSLAEEDSAARVVITLRADFYHHCAEYEGLRLVLEKHQAYIGAMTPDELRAAILQPAERNGWNFEPALVDLILQDVGAEPGALPLLSHALLETWKRRQGHTLTLQGYHEAGGVKKAIAQTAESVYDRLSPEEQTIARGIFLRLTELGEGVQDTRRRVQLDELGTNDAVGKVLKTLIDARLVTTEKDNAEVAHEALIREWGTLRKWLDEDRESLRLHRHLTESAQEWERSARNELYLVHRGGRLDDTLSFKEVSTFQINTLEQNYLEACVELRNKEQRERERRLRYTVFTSIAAAIIFLALGGFGMVKSNEAASQASTAQAASTLAVEQQLEAEIKSRIARSGELSSLALYHQESNLPLSHLLSIEAYNVMDTDSSKSSLFKLLHDNYRLKRFFYTEDDYQYAVAFHPDGKIFASIGSEGDVLFWDLKTRKIIDKVEVLDWPHVNSLIFHPNGNTIASYGGGKIIITDFNTKETVQGLSFDDVESIIYNNEGTLLAGISENEIKVWETVNYSLVFSKGKEAAKFSTGIAFSPTGDNIAFGDLDNNIFLLSLQEEKIDWLFKQEYNADCIAFDPRGKLLVVCNYKEINLWDINNYELLKTPLLGHTEAITSIVYKYDGERLYSAGWDGTIIRWNMNEYSQQGPELHGQTGVVRDLAISPDGKDLISAGGEYLILWDIWNVSFNPINSVETDVTALDVGKDKNLLATGTDDGKVYIWDIAEGASLLGTFSSNTPPVLDIEFALDDQILVFSDKGNEITIVDLESQEVLAKIWGSSAETIFGDFNPIAISPDGRTLLRIGENGGIDLIDVLSQENVMGMQSCSFGSILATDFSPDGKYVAVSTWTELCVWDLSTREEVPVNQSQDLYNVWDIAFSPDGSMLAIVNSDDILIWATDNWSRLGEPLVDNEISRRWNPPWNLSFSSDSVYLAAKYNSNVLVWDTRTHRVFGTTIVVAPEYGKIAYSPDDRYLYSGGAGTSYAGNVYVYDMQPKNWIAILCDKVGRNFTELEWEIYFPGEEYRLTCEQWPLVREGTPTEVP